MTPLFISAGEEVSKEAYAKEVTGVRERAVSLELGETCFLLSGPDMLSSHVGLHSLLLFLGLSCLICEMGMTVVLLLIRWPSEKSFSN